MLNAVLGFPFFSWVVLFGGVGVLGDLMCFWAHKIWNGTILMCHSDMIILGG